ncbi:MAG: glycosyltransferase, partial [Desulfobacterales bacterium]|nr:glycosyltransferase [Desulfobacterales bacterium]
GKDERVRLVQLRRRFGKASALQAGFDHSAGDTVITMDADLQDRPEEIQKFIQKIDQEFDLIIGHRIKVPFFRSIFSKAFNKVVSLLSGVEINDINCGLKAFKRSAIKDLRLYGELQRLFPIFVAKRGFKIGEIEVIHNERPYGNSKYGFGRIPKAFLDLFSVILLTGFEKRPLHLFGFVGIVIGLVGLLISGYLSILKFTTGSLGGHYTLLLMGVMFVILGLQWFSVGVLSELINNFSEKEIEENIGDQT